MTKHSKNNTASSVFSYAEKQKTEYGTRRQRLGNESMRNFDACSLCLQRARDPVACDQGHLFCKECVYTDLRPYHTSTSEKSLRKRQTEEKERALEAARERVLRDFEQGQLSLSSSVANAATTSESNAKEGIEKLDFDSTTVQTLMREAEEAAPEALRAKLPDFWLPSLTPTYTSKGPPSSLRDVKVQTMCRGGDPSHPINLKSLTPVQFSFVGASNFHSTESTPAANHKGDTDDKQTAICPSCKSNLSNNKVTFLMKQCSHVVCKVCTDSLVRPAKQCIVCDKALDSPDIIELKREGTGFAGGGLAETTKRGIAFQG
ncbi:hypothetical protein EDD16DRAFT_1675415 [Pisolithus croceorrhizus]|nr:hypothetical protein EDD16DRAFT_1675415 [Pisolithus croceorrhizus]